MPIYEYECIECDHNVETLQKYSDEPITICGKCGKSTLKKIISKTSFRIGGLGVDTPTTHWGDPPT